MDNYLISQYSVELLATPSKAFIALAAEDLNGLKNDENSRKEFLNKLGVKMVIVASLGEEVRPREFKKLKTKYSVKEV